MRKRVELAKIKDLLKNPSFRAQEARDRGVSSGTLAYYVKLGELKRLGPGIFCGTQFEIETDWQWEDLVKVVHSVPNGTVCLITALRLWELTDEHSREFWIAIPHGSRAPKIPGTRFAQYRNVLTGKTTIQIGGFEIPLFDETRCVLDAFRLLNIEVAIKSLKKLASQGKLDFQKMSQYSKTLRIDISKYILMVTT